MEQKPASMAKLGRSSASHSWWWDSHNSPKHSKWLQSNLQDLDEKVKEMLRLIQEDADSFAQRAEMYYQKRPELVNLVEAFYRAYRSVAESYDRLTGEIRQNIPRALQVQYGLSCDSPKVAHDANGNGRHPNSPLRRSSQMFESSPLKKAGRQMDDHHQAKESDESIAPDYTPEKGARGTRMEQIEEQGGPDDACVVNAHHNLGFSSTSASDSDVDDSTKLRQEIDALKESNRALTDSHQRTLRLNSSLLSRIEELEEGHRCKNEAADAGGKELEVEVLPYLEEEMDSCEGGDEEDTCCCNYTEVPKDSGNGDVEHRRIMHEEQGRALVDGLQYRIAQLKQEALERGEEKRAAIRQLCFSMDILKSNNQRLELTLRLLKKKKLDSVSSNGHAAHHSPTNTFWKRLFSMGDRRAFNRGATVAL